MCGLGWAGFYCGLVSTFFVFSLFLALAFIAGSFWQRRKALSRIADEKTGEEK